MHEMKERKKKKERNIERTRQPPGCGWVRRSRGDLLNGARPSRGVGAQSHEMLETSDRRTGPLTVDAHRARSKPAHGDGCRRKAERRENRRRAMGDSWLHLARCREGRCEPSVWCERGSYERPAARGVDWAGRESPKGRRRSRAMPESGIGGARKAMHRQPEGKWRRGEERRGNTQAKEMKKVRLSSAAAAACRRCCGAPDEEHRAARRRLRV